MSWLEKWIDQHGQGEKIFDECERRLGRVFVTLITVPYHGNAQVLTLTFVPDDTTEPEVTETYELTVRGLS